MDEEGTRVAARVDGVLSWTVVAALIAIVAALAAGCGTAGSYGPPADPPSRLHAAPGGGYVPGNPHYFGSGGP